MYGDEFWRIAKAFLYVLTALAVVGVAAIAMLVSRWLFGTWWWLF